MKIDYLKEIGKMASIVSKHGGGSSIHLEFGSFVFAFDKHNGGEDKLYVCSTDGSNISVSGRDARGKSDYERTWSVPLSFMSEDYLHQLAISVYNTCLKTYMGECLAEIKFNVNL